MIIQEKSKCVEPNTNPYKLSSAFIQWEIKILVGTFPGNNRFEQISKLTKMFGIQKDSKLISIEHINGNSWFTGFFSKEHERSSCLAAINKGSSDTGVKAAKLDESVKPSTHKKNMQTDTKK
jgi:hypothetical protein